MTSSIQLMSVEKVRLSCLRKMQVSTHDLEKKQTDLLTHLHLMSEGFKQCNINQNETTVYTVNPHSLSGGISWGSSLPLTGKL